jgi:hypothetical protein
VSADQFHPRRVHRHRRHQGELLVLDRQAVVGDEVVVGQRRSGRDHLRTAHHQPRAGLPFHVDEHVLDVLGGQVTIDRRVHDRVVPVEDLLLRQGVPAAGVVRERLVEVGVRAQGAQERRLVVGTAAHPAVAEPGPRGDGALVGDQVLAAVRGGEEPVRVSAAAGVGRRGEHVALRRVVQRVVQPGGHPDRVVERRMRGHVGHPVAVQIDLPAVPQRLDVLRARERACRGAFFVVLHLGSLTVRQSSTVFPP